MTAGQHAVGWPASFLDRGYQAFHVFNGQVAELGPQLVAPLPVRNFLKRSFKFLLPIFGGKGTDCPHQVLPFRRKLSLMFTSFQGRKWMHVESCLLASRGCRARGEMFRVKRKHLTTPHMRRIALHWIGRGSSLVAGAWTLTPGPVGHSVLVASALDSRCEKPARSTRIRHNPKGKAKARP